MGEQSPEIHQRLQNHMLTLMLVGAPNPWKHPDFKAFQEGFNCLEGQDFIKDVWFRLSKSQYQWADVFTSSPVYLKIDPYIFDSFSPPYIIVR